MTDVPCAVGFGISTPEQAAKMCESADGAIVGSAIVNLCGVWKRLRGESGRIREKYGGSDINLYLLG